MNMWRCGTYIVERLTIARHSPVAMVLSDRARRGRTNLVMRVCWPGKSDCFAIWSVAHLQIADCSLLAGKDCEDASHADVVSVIV